MSNRAARAVSWVFWVTIGIIVVATLVLRYGIAPYL